MPEVGQATLAVAPVLKGGQQSLTEQLKGAAGPAGSAAGSTAGESFGKQIGSFAVKAVAALGVGKAIGDSISKGMDFETSMAKASTLFTGTSSELEELRGQILDISSATGLAAADLAEAAYSAESASVPMGNLGSMIESSAKLATAGFTDVDTALSATAKTMNAYGMMTDDVAETQANMDKIQKVLIQTQNKGITTVGELGASLANVTPTAAAANVSFEQVGAALALMTAQGTPTAQATTQLRSAIAELEKSGTQASKALEAAAEGTEYAGMSFVEMMDAGADLGDVMGLLQNYADQSGVSMLDLWSSIEGGNAAMAIAKDVSAFDEDLAAMATDADVVGEAYGTMSETVSFKMEQLKKSIENIGISAFSATADDMAGALDSVSQVLGDITPALGDLGGAFMEAAGSAVDVVADILGVDEGLSTVEKTSEVLKTGIEALTGALKFASENMDEILPIATGVGGAFALMSSPLPGIAKNLAGLAGKLMETGSAASSATAPVETAGGSFETMAGGALKMVAAAVALYVTAQAISVLADAAIRVAAAGTPAIAVLAGMAVGIGALMGVAAAVAPALTAGAVGIGTFGAAAAGIGAGVLMASLGISAVTLAVGNLVTTITSNADSINSIVSNTGETVNNTITTVSDGITNVIDAVSGGISGVLDSVAGIIDSIGESALNAGTGFEKLARAVKDLTNSTSALDVGATMVAVANGVKDINSAASSAGDSAAKVGSLSRSFKTLGADVSGSAKGFKTFNSTAKSTFTSVSASMRGMKLDSSMKSAMNGAMSAANSGLASLRSAFANTRFSFYQHIAVPHFAMSGSFNAQTGSVPSVRVAGWYAKAAEYGALFTQPTIIGVGDAAQPELLIGEQKLKEMLGGGRGDIIINLNYDASDDANDMLRDIERGVKRYRMAGVF